MNSKYIFMLSLIPERILPLTLTKITLLTSEALLGDVESLLNGDVDVVEADPLVALVRIRSHNARIRILKVKQGCIQCNMNGCFG